jgi:nucleoid DNA-binding protein
MIRGDIVRRVEENVSIPHAKACAAVVATLDALRTALAAGDRIELRGFGVFKVKRRKYGVGRNPKTGVQVPIPPGKSIRFKLGKRLREFRDGG